jgi:hypothetical protein
VQVISRRHRVTGLSLAAFLAAGSLVAKARAEDDPMTACIAANDKGLDLRKQGKLMDARRTLTACSIAACGAQISAACQKRIGDINAAMPSIVFSPKDGAGNDVVGVAVTIDGAAEAQPLDGRSLPLDPGAHAFRFEVAGQPPTDRSFVIAEGEKDRREKIVLGPPLAPASASTTGAVVTSPAQAHPGSTQKTVGFVVGGVGIAGIAVGSVFGIMASSKWSSSKSECASPSSCNSYAGAVTDHDTAVTDATISTIALVAGGAALVTGILLEIAAPRESTATADSGTRLHLTPSAGPGSAGLILRGAF